MAKLGQHVRIQGENRQHCQVVVLAVSAKEECFGVCQLPFKSSATHQSKNGIVSIPCHRASNGIFTFVSGHIFSLNICYITYIVFICVFFLFIIVADAILVFSKIKHPIYNDWTVNWFLEISKPLDTSQLW